MADEWCAWETRSAVSYSAYSAETCDAWPVWLDARPTVTFPAAGHHRPLTGTWLYRFVAEARVCACACVCVCVNNLHWVVIYKLSAVANWPARQNRAIDRAWHLCNKLYSGRASEFEGIIKVDRRRSSLSRLERPPYFCRYLKFLKTQRTTDRKKPPCQNPDFFRPYVSIEHRLVTDTDTASCWQTRLAAWRSG